MSRTVDEIQDELDRAHNYLTDVIEADDTYEADMVRGEIRDLTRELEEAKNESR